MGEKERDFVVKCYNECNGKDWSGVLKYVKQHVLEAGLPEHVVHMYLTQAEERLTGRMSRITKQAIKNIPESSPIGSTSIQDSILASQEMRHARRLTPSQRKSQAVRLKSKLANEMRETSSESSSESEGAPQPRKKRKTTSDEAQEAHKKMCEQAMSTMDAVKSLMQKIDENLKNK